MRTRLDVASVPVLLNWGVGTKGDHWNRHKANCVHCGASTRLLNIDGEPAHKVCEEAWIAAGMPDRQGGRSRVH